MKSISQGNGSRWILWIAVVLLTIVPVLAVLPIGTTLAQTPVTVGIGTPESCTTTALHEAFATGDDITFDCGNDPHEITMNATVDVTGTMVVDGDDLITLHAGPNLRHFTVIDTGTLTLQDLTLSSGIATWGGVVRNQGGTLHVIGSMLSGNTASEGGAIYISANSTTTIFDSTFNLNHADERGGAIFVGENAHLTIEDSGFSENTATQDGGAIRAYSGSTVIVRGTTFQENDAGLDGGAIFIREDGELTIEGSAFDDNRAEGSGGAVRALPDTTVTVRDTTFDGNVAGNTGGAIRTNGVLNVYRSTFTLNHGVVDAGAIWVHGDGTAIIEDSTFRENYITNNSGGAIFNQTGGSLTVRRSLFVDNSARNGGAIYSNQAGTTTHIENSTFSGNTARDRGAAVVNAGGQVTIASSTIVDNVAGIAGAISVRRDSAVTNVTQTIIMTGGLSTNCEIENAASIVSDGYNIYDDMSCPATGTADMQPPAVTDTNVAVQPLAQNGGPTLTHMLGDTSIAIDKIPANLCQDVDQRGFLRPAGTACDIGAVEAGASNPAVPTASPANAETNEDAPVIVTLSATTYAQNDPVFEIQSNVLHGMLDLTGTVDCDAETPRTCTIAATYTPETDYFGSDTFTFSATGDGDEIDTAEGTLTVHPVNDAPAFMPGADETISQGAGPQIVADWATSISSGPANEAGQSVHFIILTNSNPDLFDEAPAITSDGTLTYTPSDGMFGQATITLVLEDDGGTGNGGENRSAEHTLTITVLEVTDPPVLESVTNNGPVFEGSPAQITVNLESGAGVTYAFDCDNDDVYETVTGITNTATCTFLDEGDYQVNARASNDDDTVTSNTTISVLNADPAIGDIETQVNGSQVSVTVSASDPGSHDILTYRFDCDNDTIYETDSGTTNTATCDVGNDGGTFTINVDVSDGDGGSDTGSTTVQVGLVIPETTLCAERITGLVYYPTNGTCGSKAISLDFPVAGKTHFCALMLIGTLRVSPSGFCLPFIETRYTLPNAGPLTLCIHEQSGLVRLVNERHSCHRVETRHVIG